ncbi:MAG: hypothetical protein WCN98_00330 [Verrucomicrobiaceae bacterium]
MSLNSKQDVAMVLPLPVAAGNGEDAVKFFNLEKYPKLFDDLEKGFPRPEAAGKSNALGVVPSKSAPLTVVSVGAFDASYVPSIADFSRLDARFALPPQVWDKLPGYKAFGFAVFKLKAGNTTVHPMAFTFPSAMPEKIFFPTVHIHDGEVHKEAGFDHTLYAQTHDEQKSIRNWEESPGVAMQFTKVEKAHDMIRPNQHVYRRNMIGNFKNEDVLLAAV